MIPTGTGVLTRRALRRDRVLASIWVVVLVGICYASAASTTSLYPTLADRVAAARALNSSPAIIALYGPILDEHSLGELSMTKNTVVYSIFVAMLFVLLVRRNTRAEEESGRAEMVAGTAVAPGAPLAAAVVESLIVLAVLAVLTAVGSIAGGLPVTGSVAFAVVWAGTGLAGIGISALACQLSASARTCGGIAAAAIGVLFALRAVADTATAPVARALGWLTPFGWNTRMQAFSNTRWWMVLLYVGFAGVLLALAAGLRVRRDVGSGIFAARPGEPRGATWLAGPLGLAFRVHRAALLWWTVALAAGGLLMGTIAPEMSSLLDSPGAREMMRRLGGPGALQEALLAAIISVLALLLAAFPLAVIARAGSDENDGRTEEVLATASSRASVFRAVVVVGALGSGWLAFATGGCLAIGYGKDFGGLIAATLVYLPAAWLVAGIGLIAYAVRSTWAAAGWAVLAACVLLGMGGELLQLPSWLIRLSPFTHVPLLPAASVTAGPLSALVVLTVASVIAAGIFFRHRDIG